ncbi:MAG TPA: ribokinase [Propionicimonas sp.]|nr:ribokinase [Propionicimonas sp.]
MDAIWPACARVVVVGSINVDLTVRSAHIPRPGETVPGSGPVIMPGGKGANQAVAAARLGANVSLIGAVGTDAYADVALRGLRDAGVQLDHVAQVDGPCGMAFITVDDQGENCIVVVPGANGHVDAARINEVADVIASAQLVVLQCELPLAAIERTIELARGRILLNLAPAVPLSTNCLLSADPLIVNEHEARQALALLGALPSNSEEDDLTVAEALLAQGLKSLIVTRGAEGALVADAEGMTSIPSASVTVVDSTGAGDAFVGGVSAALARGASLRDAVRYGVQVGAYACTRPGAQPSYPSAGDALPENAG